MEFNGWSGSKHGSSINIIKFLFFLTIEPLFTTSIDCLRVFVCKRYLRLKWLGKYGSNWGIKFKRDAHFLATNHSGQLWRSFSR